MTNAVVQRAGQFPAVTVSFNLGARASLGEAVKAIERAARDLDLPPAVEMRFQGAAHAFRASLSSTLLLVLAAVAQAAEVRGVVRERGTGSKAVAPISTNLILSYLAEHVLGLPRSY